MKSSSLQDCTTRTESANNFEAPNKFLSREQLSFLPAALEVQHAPPAKFSRIILWTIMLLLFLMMLWASWASVDIIATAQGKIVPSGQVKIIQPLTPSVVRDIHVSEGQKVKAGELLISLDSTQYKADLARLEQEQFELSADLARFSLLLARLDASRNKNQSQNDGTEEVTSAELNLLQRKLLENQWEEYQAKITGPTKQLNGLQGQWNDITNATHRSKKNLPEIQERLKKLTQKMNDVQSQLTTINRHYENQYLVEQQRISRGLHGIKQEIIKAKNNILAQQLRSPVDGVVDHLRANTIGGVVATGEEVMRVIPDGQSLVIEAGLLNKDIGFVEVGQIAEIKVDSFPFTRYGIIEGEVIHLSFDAMETDNAGLIFPIKTSISDQFITVGNKQIALIPGMSVTVEIKTGRRRVIEFLLAPLFKAWSEGIRER